MLPHDSKSDLPLAVFFFFYISAMYVQQSRARRINQRKNNVLTSLAFCTHVFPMLFGTKRHEVERLRIADKTSDVHTVLNVNIDANFLGIGRVTSVLPRVRWRHGVDQKIGSGNVPRGIGLYRYAATRTRVVDCLRYEKKKQSCFLCMYILFLGDRMLIV